MPKKKPQIRIVSIDDWCAVYIDGKSVYQQHDVEADRLLSILEKNGIKLNLDIEWVQGGSADEEKAHEYGQLPELAKDLIDTELA